MSASHQPGVPAGTSRNPFLHPWVGPALSATLLVLLVVRALLDEFATGMSSSTLKTLSTLWWALLVVMLVHVGWRRMRGERFAITPPRRSGPRHAAGPSSRPVSRHARR